MEYTPSNPITPTSQPTDITSSKAKHDVFECAKNEAEKYADEKIKGFRMLVIYSEYRNDYYERFFWFYGDGEKVTYGIVSRGTPHLEELKKQFSEYFDFKRILNG